MKKILLIVLLLIVGCSKPVKDSPLINKQDLQKDFDILKQSVQMLQATGPFNLKLDTTERIWYRAQADLLSSAESVIPAGGNDLLEFNQSLNIFFKHNRGLNLYLNGNRLNSFEKSSHPVRITISTEDKTLTIQYFTPKN